MSEKVVAPLESYPKEVARYGNFSQCFFFPFFRKKIWNIPFLSIAFRCHLGFGARCRGPSSRTNSLMLASNCRCAIFSWNNQDLNLSKRTDVLFKIEPEKYAVWQLWFFTERKEWKSMQFCLEITEFHSYKNECEKSGWSAGIVISKSLRARENRCFPN